MIAVDFGRGFLDYGTLLEMRGYKSEISAEDPDTRIIRLIRRGMLDEDFAADMADWAARTGRAYRIETAGLTPLLPLKPQKIICIARNWAEHAREGGYSPPTEPVYFAKTSNCAIGPGIPIKLPENLGRVDHEGELGIVIGRLARKVNREAANEFVFGYTLINDVTAREIQKKYSDEGWPWYRAKSLDGFAPIGPYIVSRLQFEPYEGKRIRVYVNDKIRQDGSLDEMLWKVPDLIEAVSRDITLETGDIIATGTPPGVGPLSPGDRVTIEMEGLGRLTNPVE